MSAIRLLVCLIAAAALLPCAPVAASPAHPEVRGTWLTTTANSALRTPADTAASMRRLKEIGINTVYVEAWKEGHTQFPSRVLAQAVGEGRPVRDLLQESLIEAHRNGLLYVAWFEYGFMAAQAGTMNQLRRQKPDWLSRDIHGSDVAPNGFVWLNPLHPEARALLLGLVLEAVDNYDLDGIQLDDRIVWPHVTMGYDAYTQAVYAGEHGGKRAPADFKDPEWMQWRADKVSEFARQFVREIRQRRPGLLISLSPAVYPWSWEHYLLAWPEWSAWGKAQGWDEFIPQAYRFSYPAFEATWRQQVAAVRELGADRQRDLVAGIRITGDGADSSWDQLRRSILLTRELGNGGHVLWFSRGVLDLYGAELTRFYRDSGPAPHPHFGAGWRLPASALVRESGDAFRTRWRLPPRGAGSYRLIGRGPAGWRYLGAVAPGQRSAVLPAAYREAEMILDRRPDMR